MARAGDKFIPKVLLKICLFEFQKAIQLPDARGVPHFAERLGFDLPDALARDPELAADFF